jgi:hypothetical protein
MRPHTACVVHDCGLGRGDNPLLPLCPMHRSALERHCKGKDRHVGVRLARRALAALVAAGRDRQADGVQAVAYRCELCRQYHVGHIVPDSPASRGATQAADALRTNLTADQFAELVASWRYGRVFRNPDDARQKRGTR